jgi:hypothetical protein
MGTVLPTYLSTYKVFFFFPVEESLMSGTVNSILNIMCTYELHRKFPFTDTKQMETE